MGRLKETKRDAEIFSKNEQGMYLNSKFLVWKFAIWFLHRFFFFFLNKYLNFKIKIKYLYFPVRFKTFHPPSWVLSYDSATQIMQQS